MFYKFGEGETGEGKYDRELGGGGRGGQYEIMEVTNSVEGEGSHRKISESRQIRGGARQRIQILGETLEIRCTGTDSIGLILQCPMV